MSYLLDTNACIALIKGTPASVRNSFATALKAEDEVFTSAIVSFELWYGVAKSARPEANAENLGAFFSGPVSVLTFDEDDARAAGKIRAELEGVGKPIGAYDLLIAGQALRRKLTLVTANVSEFARVKGLTWQDWAKRKP